MRKRYEKAERKLKLKPAEVFNPDAYKFFDLPTYTVYNKVTGISWEIPQHVIDNMNNDECTAIMDQLREEAKRGII